MTARSVSDSAAAEADIVAAYRIFLGRDPDAPGLQHFLQYAAEGELKVGDLLKRFGQSEEFLSVSAVDQAGSRPIDIGGLLVFVDPEEPEFGRHLAAHANWEPHLTAFLQRHLRPGEVFVDVGANVGVMAFTAARAVGSEGRVICFEPNGTNAQQLMQGVIENKFETFVQIHQLALSDAPHIFSLAGSSNAFLIKRNKAGRCVQAVRGDTILAGQTRVDFIKIDIEGHEPFALAGLADTLRRHRPRILCEFNPRCLNHHIGKPPADFAAELFQLNKVIEVIEHNGASQLVRDATGLIDLWVARNQEAVRTGLLPDGMLHFDLFFQVED